MSSTEVQPIADNFAERCKCTTLTIKWCAEQSRCFAAANKKVPAMAVRFVLSIVATFRRALQLPHSDNKMVR